MFLGVIIQTMINAMILEFIANPLTWNPFIGACWFLKQLLKKWILLKSSSAEMLPFITFSPSLLIPTSSIHIEGVIFMVTPFTFVSNLSSFTFRWVKNTFTRSGYTFPVSSRNFSSPCCSSNSLT